MSISIKELFDNSVADNYKSALLSASSVADKYCCQIYLIGGVVRDLILNNKIKDIDIAVEGDAVNFCKILEKETNCKIIAVQEKLKTVKVKFENQAEIDFASTREEKYSQSGVLPCAYNFGCCLKNDVKRRDFTINTLAVSLNSNDKYLLTDYYQGYEDIKNKKIKVLHNKSFIDDPSRIIRALKFQARFDFDIEEETSILMQNYLQNVDSNIPLERIKNELIQYFSINKQGLYNKIIETNAYKLISDNPVLNLDENVIKELEPFNLFNQDDLWFVFVACMIINSDIQKRKLNFTSFEIKVTEEVKSLLNTFSIDINNKLILYKKFNNKNNISLAIYYILTKDETVKIFLNELKQIKVLTKGIDLINLGFIPSSYFNEIFEKILKEKLYGKIKTKEEEIEFVKQLKKNNSSID